MSLAYYARNSASADRLRHKIRREGYTLSGKKVWSPEEDEVLKRLYPDYKRIVKVLKGRTLCACRARCQKLNIADQRHTWTGAEVARLRRLYPTATKEVLAEAFPDVSARLLKATANRFGIHKKRLPYTPTGVSALDELRTQCFKNNLYMSDLDAIIGRRTKYFTKAHWLSNVRPSYERIVRAIIALEGKIKVEWPE